MKLSGTFTVIIKALREQENSYIYLTKDGKTAKVVKGNGECMPLTPNQVLKLEAGGWIETNKDMTTADQFCYSLTPNGRTTPLTSSNLTSVYLANDPELRMQRIKNLDRLCKEAGIRPEHGQGTGLSKLIRQIADYGRIENGFLVIPLVNCPVSE